ncbi:MAG: hypothetical protein GX159_09875 [Flavobacteriaceae bacterium]|jgi:hypothetical protein|nr:hypothetical protein [Flavobacteriaceae bacterium]
MKKEEIKVTELSASEIEKAGGVANLRRVELPLDESNSEFLEIVVCVPDRNVMGQYLRFQQTNPKKAFEILVKNCVLTHKDQVLGDDHLFFTAVSQISELIPIRDGKTKKY